MIRVRARGEEVIEQRNGGYFNELERKQVGVEEEPSNEGRSDRNQMQGQEYAIGGEQQQVADG